LEGSENEEIISLNKGDMKMGFGDYLIGIVALIVTAVSGQFENNVLPMLFSPVEYQHVIKSGIAQGYGWPFPFRLKVWMLESYDWVTFIIDVVIIWIILVGFYSIIKKYR